MNLILQKQVRQTEASHNCQSQRFPLSSTLLRNQHKEVAVANEFEFVDESKTGEETYRNCKDTDEDYTQQEDNRTDDEDEDDQDLKASAHKTRANIENVPN